MINDRLHRCRSLLFLPASNPRAIEKARGLEADMIVLDLEDAVKPEAKDDARIAALAAAKEGFGDRLVAIRVNAKGDPHYGEDMLAARSARVDCIILPKVGQRQAIHDARALSEKPVLAMIETAAGVLGAFSIAGEAAALVAGTNDLSVDLGIPVDEARAGLVYSLQAVVVAARAAGIPAFDGVYNGLEDEAGLARQAAQGRSFGFNGKSIIHPAQVDAVNRAFAPSEAELDAAARLVAAASGGAERFEGRMIESLHVLEAKAMLARHGR